MKINIKPKDKTDPYSSYYLENLTHKNLKKTENLVYYHTVEKVDREKGIIHIKNPLLEDFIKPTNDIILQEVARNENAVEDLHLKAGSKKAYVHTPGKSGSEPFRGIAIWGNYNWMRNVVVSNAHKALAIGRGLNNSLYNCITRGIAGHYNFIIERGGGMNSLINCINAQTTSTHGVTINSPANVIYKYVTGKKRGGGLDPHSAPTSSTLVDASTMSNIDNRGGGQGPHHYRFLLFWNVNFILKQKKDFWRGGSQFIKPSFVGIHGMGVEFQNIGFFALRNRKFKHLSLYEAQLELRLKKKPKWLEETIELGKKTFKHWVLDLRDKGVYINLKKRRR